MADFMLAWENDSALSVRLVEQGLKLGPKGLGPLLVAQAAFRRDPFHDMHVSNRPDGTYGSWIENLSLLHPLMHNERVVVDLISSEDEDDFIKRYGVTPSQFSRLANEGWIVVNVRDGIGPDDGADAVRRHSFASEDTLCGSLFRALPQKSVIMGPILREGIFSALSPDQGLERRFKELLPLCRQWIGELSNAPTNERNETWYRLTLTRANKLPHERALAYRIAYHACYRQGRVEDEFSQPGGFIGTDAMNRFLDNDFADGNTLHGRMQRAQSIFYAGLFHHRDTAPLTGAWGGQYAVTTEEHSAMRNHLLTDTERQQLDPEFDSVIEELITTRTGDVTDRGSFAFKVNAKGALPAEGFEYFLKYKSVQKTSGLATAQAKLRDALHDLADEAGLERTAETYKALIGETAERRHKLLVNFAESYMWPVVGGIAGIAMASKAGPIGKLAASWIGMMAASKKTKTCTYLASLTGFKQKHRDIYGAVSDLQRSKF